MTRYERVMSLVSPEPNTGCWLWMGAEAGGCGPGERYGYYGHGPAHRVVYEMVKGPIPDGLQLDHLCRCRMCVNPDHLEPVTRAENVRRGMGPQMTRLKAMQRAECKNGHLLTPSNIVFNNGRQLCLTCKRDYQRARRARIKAD